MKKGLKIALTVVMIGLAAAITFVDFSSVNRPIEFEKKAHARDTVVINRLIAIKDAEVAYRKEKGAYTNDFDSLINFVKSSKSTTIVKEFELNDRHIDLIAGYKKNDLKKAGDAMVGVTPDEAHAYIAQILKSGDKTRINEINSLIIIPENRKEDKEWIKRQMVENKYRRDTISTNYIIELYNDPNFPVDSLRYVPFGNGAEFELITNESGDLFEARVDFEVYMKGIDDQELANYLLRIRTSNQQLRRIPVLDEEGNQIFFADGSKKEILIPCRIIGNAESPNNNAGNWPEN